MGIRYCPSGLCGAVDWDTRWCNGFMKKNGNVSGYWYQFFFCGIQLLKEERNGCEGDVELLQRAVSWNVVL